MTLQARHDDAVDARLVELLRPWLPHRRWYPAKGRDAHLAAIGSIDLVPPSSGQAAAAVLGGAASAGRSGHGPWVRVLLVHVAAAGTDLVLQVPLVLETGVPSSGGDLIGVLDDLVVRDGAGHPAFLRAWLAAAQGPGAVLDPDRARVLTGEQSNTSVILPGPGDGPPVAILKVLRALAAGENPDVDVPRHLVAAGWHDVPEPLAWLEATWTGPDGLPATGYLGAMSAFVPEPADGFELACGFARDGRPFDGLAAGLGTVVAGMHAALRSAFGPTDDPDGPDRLAQALLTRYAWAAEAAPALVPYGPAVAAVADRVRALPSTPPRQRVHGDLHLGQVLRSGDRWFVTDFEGEPLAPLAERVRPDLALRDVAGVLRSFDYAAAVGGLTGADADAWTGSAREALLRAYLATADAGRAPSSDDGLLLLALELDKTLYEAVYESRNRPTWLAIPLAGLNRLLG